MFVLSQFMENRFRIVEQNPVLFKCANSMTNGDDVTTVEKENRNLLL